MKFQIKLLFITFLSVLLGACGIGGYWMNGDPSGGKNVKPYGAHWIKDGMTKESRLNDLVACGSGRTEYVLFSDEKIHAAKKPEDINNFKAKERLSKQWVSCMRDKGYVHLEYCDARCLYP